MRIFGKEREYLRIKRVRASRAVYHDKEIQRVEVKVMTEEGNILTLEFTSRDAVVLQAELGTAIDAIYPRRPRFGTDYATWDGMRDE